MHRLVRRVVALLYVVIAGAFLAACGGGGGGSAASPPVIGDQPADVTTDDGASARFSVTASGDAPLTFQWRRNGVAIAGANAASYVIPAVALADTGVGFSVSISGPGGAVTSRPAVLTVRPVAPIVAAGPQDAAAPDGGTASFSATATGSAPLSYQWLREGVPIDGATTATFTTDVLTLADDGATYSVVVSNVAGSATSAVASLSVSAVAPTIVAAPTDLTVRDGSTATLSVAATGSAPLSYQWFDGASPIAGATQAQYSFGAVFADSGKTYRVEVSNAVGSVSTASVTVVVDANAPAVDVPPASLTVAAGGRASFAITASGTAPLSYQWQRSDDAGATWTPIAGVTSATLDVPQAGLAWANAQLRVVVSNAVGSAASAAATLAVVPNVHIVAGAIGGPGFSNGTGEGVRLNFPSAAVADAAGNVYVSDTNNRVIRRVAPGGATSVFVAPGSLLVPRAMAVDGSGLLFVEDAGTLRTVGSDGTVSFLAGGSTGSADGAGATASFALVVSMAADAGGNLFVVDGGVNQTVRRVTPSGTVTTLAGTAGQLGVADGQGAAARFTDLRAIALDALGNAYVADNHAIRQVSPTGDVTLFAGLPGQAGNTDGPRLAARFDTIGALAFDADGSLFVADTWQIRRIAPDGTTTTIAGGTPAPAAVDGTGAAARVVGVSSMARLPSGQGVVFTEPSSATVRRVTAGGVVSTLAGVAPRLGSVDATGASARFQDPRKVIALPDGTLVVAEGPGLRRIAADGAVTTLASTGNLATFSASDVARGPAGEYYVADPFSHVIHRVAADGTITLWAGVADTPGSSDGPAASATFSNPEGIAVDAGGVVYVADSGNHTIRRIDPSGAVTTLAGSPGQCGGVDGTGATARLCGPLGLAVGPGGDVFVADTSSHTIRRITPGGVVTTYAGVLNSPGRSDGPVARFLNPRGVAFDGLGNLFVADTGNSLVRRVTTTGLTSTVMGQPGIAALVPGPAGPINAPSGVAVHADGRVVITSEQAIVGD